MNTTQQQRILFVCIGVLLLPTLVLAEITCKIVKNPDATVTKIFYSKSKEIAKETRDKGDCVIEIIGKIPDGVCKEYYESGKLMALYNYKGNKLEGMSTFYYEDGSSRGERNYKNGKLEGKSRFFYTSGALSAEWNYKEGTLEGKTMLYWGNGNVKADYNYKNGTREGVNTWYYENRVVRSVEVFEKGKMIHQKKYDNKGKIIAEH